MRVPAISLLLVSMTLVCGCAGQLPAAVIGHQAGAYVGMLTGSGLGSMVGAHLGYLLGDALDRRSEKAHDDRAPSSHSRSPLPAPLSRIGCRATDRASQNSIQSV